MTNTDFNTKKEMIRSYAKLIGLSGYSISFTSNKKDAIRKHHESNLKNKEKLEFIIQKVNKKFNIDIKTKTRKTEYVCMRHAFIHYMYKNHSVSPISLAMAFEKDHSTVLYSIEKSDTFIQIKDDKFCEVYEEIREFLKKYKKFMSYKSK